MADVELIIKIPEDHEIDLDDKFQDFFKRLRFEITRHITTNTSLACGAYELETVDMLMEAFAKSTPRPKTGLCKDCKWWKDSDGAFRRGIGAESQCPLNREEVYEGNGYCYLFKSQESEEGNDYR